MKSGKVIFKRRGGAYNPVVSDGKTIYLTGYNTIAALEPGRKRHNARKAQRQAQR